MEDYFFFFNIRLLTNIMFRLFHRNKITIMAMSDATNQLVFAESLLIQTSTRSTPKKRTKNIDFTEMARCRLAIKFSLT